MKYKSEKTLRRAKKAFSLIELMIVIVIIGALTAIILPQFDVSEAEAKDTGCDASNYGTLSQLTKFRAVHSCYPSRMHTGYEGAASNAQGSTLMGITSTGAASETNYAVIPSFTAYNMALSSIGTAIIDNDTAETYYATSLRAAGIVSLASGGFPVDTIDSTTQDNYVSFLAVLTGGNNLNVRAISQNWYEAWQVSSTTGGATEGSLDGLSTPISINGVPLPFYAHSDPQLAYSADPDAYDSAAQTVAAVSAIPSTTIGTSAVDGIVVPLILAPTTDWEHWYDADGIENDSKIQVAQVGACPWLEGGAEFRYYIGIFKIYADGTKAKLLGTMCPEGGSLNP